VFDYYGVQVAFEHHDHAYKRSLRLKNNKPHPNGTLYMGDGCWGIKQPRVNNLHKWYIANYRSARNVLAVTIENDKYKIQAFNEQGEVFDEVTSPDLQLREQSGQTLKLAPAILVH
jgi:hypothetical protein